ncbi:MAG: DUF302 domain-containing protein [Candidatus Heimdallarchaeota archaeon]|nr:DUF302 domain-containing protein [Candidatus Heimdallarchaeota archaeon]
MVEILRKCVNESFDEAVEHVKTVIENEGFTVLLVKSIDEIIQKKLGETIQRYTTILACAADLAKMALEVSVNVGTLFPCSFVIYEDGSEVIVAHVSIMKIAAELGLASPESMIPVILETGKRIQAVWQKI